MNKREIIFLLTGIAAGVGGSFYFIRQHYTKLMNEEIDKIVDYYDQKLEEIDGMVKDLSDDIVTIKDEDERQQVVEKAQGERVDYSSIIKNLNMGKYSTATDAVKDSETFNNAASKIIEDQNASRFAPPYIITEDEYIEDTEYGKEIVSYFEDDGVFMLENEEVLDNGAAIIGTDNIEHFNEDDNEDEGVIHVRNEKMGMDYKVILEPGSYARFAAGDYDED